MQINHPLPGFPQHLIVPVSPLWRWFRVVLNPRLRGGLNLIARHAGELMRVDVFPLNRLAHYLHTPIKIAPMTVANCPIIAAVAMNMIRSILDSRQLICSYRCVQSPSWPLIRSSKIFGSTIPSPPKYTTRSPM